MHTADLIIIGGGPGGYEIAAAQASKGRKVILIEKDHLGGTCLNRGCIPTKCLCASAAVINNALRAEEYGISIGTVEADYTRAHARACRIVDEIRSDLTASLSGVEVIHGTARLNEGPVVCVDDRIYSAPAILIATGSRPAALKGVTGSEYAIDSDSFLALDRLPLKAVIIGGGVIGLEFASILCAFGVKVSIVEFCKEILPGFDADIAKRLRQALGRRGIDIFTGAKVEQIEPQGKGVCYSGKKGKAVIECDAVIAAVGRRPVLPEGLEKTGVELTECGFIKVDSHMRTSAPGIFAAGDVTGLCMLAHAATAQARVALGENIRLDAIPGVVFTEPEAATVGLCLDAAAEIYPDPKAVKVPFSANAKAVADGHADGLLKLVYDAHSRKILGCQALGAHSADLIAEIAAAMGADMTVDDLSHSIVHAHPSISELIATAALRC